jgi:predicted DNA-binding ribbon-helix-helix protein
MIKKHKFALRLSEEQMKTLRAIAEKEKRTVSAVIRNLVDDIKEKGTQGKVRKTGN